MEIVTNNSPAIAKATKYLADKYQIWHITISGYNSQANGMVEVTHFDIWQVLFKAANRDKSQWLHVAGSVFWADRVTIRKHLGCSPYFALTGTHPVLLLDIANATYLLLPPNALLMMEQLIVRRVKALQKRAKDLEHLCSRVLKAQIDTAKHFEKDHWNTICDFNFDKDDLVLVRNMAIEKSLNRKIRVRYLGLMVVLARNRGRAYIVCKLDSSVFNRPVVAFRLIPYFAHHTVDLPNLETSLDILQ